MNVFSPVNDNDHQLLGSSEETTDNQNDMEFATTIFIHQFCHKLEQRSECDVVQVFLANERPDLAITISFIIDISSAPVPSATSALTKLR